MSVKWMEGKMNNNPAAHRILCYGDSNTWGRSGASVERYPLSVRWTGLLQKNLGSDFVIIEEGLRSRTTDLDDNDPQFPGRNGSTYLRPCLESHNPLDIVVLWLGTNDLKEKFDRQSEEVAQAIEKLVEMIQTHAHTTSHQPPKIILISPPLVSEDTLKPNSQFRGAGIKSQKLAHLLQKGAEANNCSFINLALHVSPGKDDGVHLDPDQHVIVEKLIRENFLELNS